VSSRVFQLVRPEAKRGRAVLYNGASRSESILQLKTAAYAPAKAPLLAASART
jgi:hypothetical protein